MSISLDVRAFASKGNPEFIKHFNVVKVCIDSGVSFPPETVAFFDGKIGGDGLDDVNDDVILRELEQGVTIPMQVEYHDRDSYAIINVSDIPKEADRIIITLS